MPYKYSSEYFSSPASRAQGTMEYLVIIAVVIVISLVVVGMSGALVGDSGGQVATNTTDLSSKTGSVSGGVAIIESATDSSGNGLIKLNNFTGEGFSLTKVSTVSPSGSLVDNNFNSAYIDSSGSLAFSLEDLGSACACVAGETKKSCTFVIEYTAASGLAKSQRLTTNVACVSAISSSGVTINPLDQTSPVVSITSPESGSTISNTGEVDFEYTVTDNNEVKECSLLIDDVIEDTDDTAPFDSFTYEFSSNDDYTYEVECEDYSNNTGSDTGTLTMSYFDETNPSVTLSSPEDDNSTGTAAVDFNFYVSDNNALSQCVLVVDSADVNTITSVTNSAYNLISYSLSTGGAHTWDVRCTDYGNNSATSGAARDITYDRVYSYSAAWAKGPVTGSGTWTLDGRSVVADSNGNVYAVGNLDPGNLGFGGVNNDVNVTGRGSTDFYLVKYNSSGVAQWARGAASGSGTGWDSGNSVAVDSNGNVYVAGGTQSNPMGFGNDINLTNRGSTDFFVVKYDSSGTAQFVLNPASGSGTSSESASGVFVDSNDNIYVVGSFQSTTLSFGNDKNLTNRGGSNDFFVAKYNSSGVAQWANDAVSGSGTGDDRGQSVAVDSSGNVYVTGMFSSSTLSFGGASNDVNLTTRGGNDFFVVKYNSNGVAQWAKNPVSGSGTGADYGYGVAVDSSGNVYVSGYFTSSTSFGNDVNLTSRGNTDFFVVKYNSSGVTQWAQNPAAGTGTNDEAAYIVKVDSSGNVYATGYWTYSASLGFGNGLSISNSVVGTIDFFVVKYDSNGVAQWVKGIVSGSGASHDYGQSIAVDSSSNVYIMGNAQSPSMDFGNGATLTRVGGTIFFVTKYAAS